MTISANTPPSYHIPEAQTCVRGTLRYAGFPPFIKTLVDIGFLDDQPKDYLNEALPWNETLAKISGAKSGSEDDLVAAISAKATTFKTAEVKSQLIKDLKWRKQSSIILVCRRALLTSF